MVAPTLTPEVKALFDEVKKELGESSKVKAAVAQLEEQMRGLPATLENKISAMRRTMYEPMTGRYRGVLGSEETARSFGLYVMAGVGGDSRARSALKSEFKDVYERAWGDDPSSSPVTTVEVSNRIQRLVEDNGVFARDAFKMTMPASNLTFGRQTGGLTVFKGSTPTEADGSEPTFAEINLNSDNWNVLSIYPKDLEVDSAQAIGEMVALQIGEAYAEKIDDVGFTGDGTPASLDVFGITTRLQAINGVDDGGGVVLGSGNSWSEITLENFLEMKGRARFARKGKFYGSQEFYWTVAARLILASGGVTAADIEGVRQLSLLGSAYEVVHSMPRVEGNSQICCLYGDLSRSSTHGVRQEMMIEESRHAKFIARQVTVMASQRHDIANHSLGDDTTAGPMVGLMTQSG